MDDELDSFKSRINLTEYAASHGYRLDTRESSKNSAVMRQTGGDKIIVAREKDGHWVYFSPHDSNDNGTIIDFVLRRVTGNFGELRKALRPWSGNHADFKRPHPATYAHVLEPVTRDLAKVVRQVGETRPALTHAYLEERGIPAEMLASRRFVGKVRIDLRSNAVFPHHNQCGLCGFELKNYGFTGFASGGTKGLWFSATNKEDCTLVIAESGIDALSYAALHPDPTARYASIAGSLNLGQPELIAGAIKKMGQGSRIILATDHDEAGEALASCIEELAGKAQRTDLTVVRHLPAQPGQDWNDVLRGSQSDTSRVSAMTLP